MGDQHPKPLEAVQGDQTRDAGVFGVVFLLGWAPTPGDQVRVDRDHREPGVEEALDEHPVAGLEHDPHLGRVRFQLRDPGDQRVERSRVVLNPGNVEHPLARPAKRHQVELLSPVDPYPQHACSLRCRVLTTEAQRRADGPVLKGRHRCWRQASKTARRGRGLISVLKGQAQQAFPGGGLSHGR